MIKQNMAVLATGARLMEKGDDGSVYYQMTDTIIGKFDATDDSEIAQLTIDDVNSLGKLIQWRPVELVDKNVDFFRYTWRGRNDRNVTVGKWQETPFDDGDGKLVLLETETKKFDVATATP